MKILNKALPPFLATNNIFRKKKQRYIHKGDNDDADNNDNNERPHLFIFHSSSIREIKFNDISLTESPDLLNALIQ